MCVCVCLLGLKRISRVCKHSFVYLRRTNIDEVANIRTEFFSFSGYATTTLGRLCLFEYERSSLDTLSAYGGEDVESDACVDSRDR